MCRRAGKGKHLARDQQPQEGEGKQAEGATQGGFLEEAPKCLQKPLLVSGSPLTVHPVTRVREPGPNLVIPPWPPLLQTRPWSFLALTAVTVS